MTSQSASKGVRWVFFVNFSFVSIHFRRFNVWMKSMEERVTMVIYWLLNVLNSGRRRVNNRSHVASLDCFLDSLTGFFHFLMAGLISPHWPTMSSAILLPISRLSLEFKENLAGSIVDELLSTMILVLQSKERQIVQVAVSLCRVLLIMRSTKRFYRNTSTNW